MRSLIGSASDVKASTKTSRYGAVSGYSGYVAVLVLITRLQWAAAFSSTRRQLHRMNNVAGLVDVSTNRRSSQTVGSGNKVQPSELSGFVETP